MIKVYGAIHGTGINSAMQNAGIYFREIKSGLLPADTAAEETP